MQKLIATDKVIAIIGGQCSGETLAAAPIANLAKVPLISPVSSSPDVTKAGVYVFRDYPSDALKGVVMAQYLKSKGLTKVAMMTANTDYAMGFRMAFMKEMGQGSFATDEIVESDAKDFRTLMTKLKGKKFDVFVPNTQTDAMMGIMITQFRDAGFTQPMVTQDVGDSINLLTLAPRAVEGMQAINVANVGEGSAFERTFIATYGQPKSNMSFAVLAHDAAAVLFEVMKTAGTDGPKIKDGLLALKGFTGVAGTFHFDSNGDVVGIPYGLKQFIKGKIVQVSKIDLQ